MIQLHVLKIALHFAVLVGALSALLSAQDVLRSSDVIFHCDFESEAWWVEWGLRDTPKRVDTVGEDPQHEFKPHDGKALRIRVVEGGHYGVSLQYQFAKRLGNEPDEIYFRYYLRLGSDWKPENGGKLPGIAGTSGRAGWGGEKFENH